MYLSSAPPFFPSLSSAPSLGKAMLRPGDEVFKVMVFAGSVETTTKPASWSQEWATRLDGTY